ncbi:MAG: hypothetical protein DRG87_07880, partial [Deltaproteobacteria bacterium]
MSAPLEAIISAMISSREKPQSPLPIDLAPRFDGGRKDNGDIARSLNAAFLIALAGTMHPASERAHRYLAQMAASRGWDEVAAFYLRGIGHISREIDDVCEHNPQFALHLRNLTEWMSHKENLNDVGETAEKMWSVFFPEAQGILDHERQRVAALRKKRMVTVTQLNPSPITNPAREMLFTANVLLTIPSAHTSLHELPFSDELTE